MPKLTDHQVKMFHIKMEGFWWAEAEYNFEVDPDDLEKIMRDFGFDDLEQIKELLEEFGYTT